MNFSCENCQRRYTLPDERILDRAIRVRCKQCGTIRTLGPLLQPSEAEPGEERTRMVGLEELERLKAQAGQPDSSPWDDEPTRTVPQATGAWFTMIQGKQAGPFDPEALFGKVSSGAVQPRTFVWRDGMADWKRAADVAELAPLFQRSAAEAHSDSATATHRPRAGKVRVVHPRPAEPSPQGASEAAPVTASQILDTEDVQRALQATPPRPPPAAPRRPTAELDAAELFGGLELSKISRMPQPPDLSDLLEPHPAPAAAGDTPDTRRTQPSLPAVPRPGSATPRTVRRARPASRPGPVAKALVAVAVVVLVTVTGLAAASGAGLIRLEVGAIDASSGAPVNVPLLSPQGWQALSARLKGQSARVRSAALGAPTPPAVAQPASP